MTKFLSYVQQKDNIIFHIITHKIKCKILDIMMPILTHFGGAAFTISLSIFMIIVGSQANYNWGIKVFISLAVSHFIIHVLKRVINRPRPTKELLDTKTFNSMLQKYSFPSGHTTAIFSIAISFSLIFPKFLPFTVFIACLVGISRIYIGVHYPTDVLIGALIGATTAILVNEYIFLFINDLSEFASKKIR